jgi:hypothetical protein
MSQAMAAPSSLDHLDAVTGIGPSAFLQHFVTGGRDSHVKVFDRDKALRRAVYLGSPVSAAVYLNDAGKCVCEKKREREEVWDLTQCSCLFLVLGSQHASTTQQLSVLWYIPVP